MNQMDLKSDRWAFTSWISPLIPLKYCKLLIWQSELCPTTGSMHYQGYVEFKKEYSGKYVKSLFKDKTIHVAVAEKCREANVYYCSKKDTKQGEYYEYRDASTVWDELPIE